MKSFINKKTLKSLAVLCLIIVASTIASHVYAVQVDSTYTPLAPLPNLDSTNLAPANTIGFQDYVKYLFNILIGVGAVMAVFMITWGGFDYMTSDAVNGKKEGLSKIKNAIYGLLLILSSILILRTINPQFAAIPVGLVPPANLEQPTSGIADWMNKLDTLSADFQNAAGTAVAAKIAARGVVTDLQRRLDTAQGAAVIACGSYNSSSLTPECMAAQANITDLQDKLNQAKSDFAQKGFEVATTGTLNTVFSGGVASTTNANGANTNTFLQSDLAAINRAETTLDKAYAIAVDAVQQSGGDPSIMQNINTEYNISRAQLQAQNYLALVQQSNMDADQAITNITRQQQIINNQTLTYTNVTQMQQYNTNVQAVLTQLRAASYIQNTHSGPSTLH